jgi:ABC-type sulfate/molybdate transport systems ATPase subunit
MALNHALKVAELSMHYGDARVLHDVSFSIRSGEHTAILGESGSGKSTLLRLLAGLETPTEGEIWLDGRRASSAGAILRAAPVRSIGMVFQDLALWPNLSALANVELGLPTHRLDAATRRARAFDALASCGLGGLENRLPASLSMGQQQRVAFARALATRPVWLLLDEPFASLDLVLREHLIGELGRLVAAFDCTLLLVTHDPVDARSLCSQLLVLEAGTVMEAGPWDRVMAAPRSNLLRFYRARAQGALS